MTSPTPNWVIDLVNAVATYGDEHGHPDDGHACLGQTLARVPDEIRSQARAVRAYVAQQRQAELASNLDDILDTPKEH